MEVETERIRLLVLEEGSEASSALAAGGVGAIEVAAVAKLVLDERDDAGRLLRLSAEPPTRDVSRCVWAAERGRRSIGEVGEYRRPPPPLGVEAAEGTSVARSSSSSTYN